MKRDPARPLICVLSILLGLTVHVSLEAQVGFPASFRPQKPEDPAPKGGAARPMEEPMGRGVVALPVKDGIYVGWRLLRDDPPGVAFDVFRQIGTEKPVKVNEAPVVQTTDFLDANVPGGASPVYTVRAAGGARAVTGSARTAPRVEGTPFVRIRLNRPDTQFQKVGIADLNGDGQYDYVIKQPDENIDPWHKYWHRSPDTYRIEAYLGDGTFLWRHDLGWAIERGIWYSPWIAFDLTGDGEAEVAAKIGEGDPRDEDGRVTGGAEWLVVWESMTGREIARAPWPDRKDFPDYNRASRNQLAVAYLDGKTPSLLALRGTYDRMRVDAYRLASGRLELLWRYDNKDLGRPYRGQGAHFTLAADVDDDGRDEVILGSAVLDDTGVPLWTTGKGHPDAAYLTDVDPQRAGLEIAYVMETRQKKGGLCLADARTGRLLWELDEPTGHVHGKGLCADIDPLHPGMEIYGADSVSHKMTDKRWMFTAGGQLLLSGKELEFGFDIGTAYWDGDLQKEITGREITNYGGLSVLDRPQGRIRIVADVIGDWREELITSTPGELRIYSTTIPAMDRRICLMQDPVYRLATAMNAMGYTQAPTTSYCPEATAPNLNLTVVRRKAGGQGLGCRVFVSAPEAFGFKGQVELTADAGIVLHPSRVPVDVKPGGRMDRTVEVEARGGTGARGLIEGTLNLKEGTLRARVPVRVPSRSSTASR